MRLWRGTMNVTCEQVLREGGVTVRVGELWVWVLVLVTVTADTQVRPRTKYGAIAVREKRETILDRDNILRVYWEAFLDSMSPPLPPSTALTSHSSQMTYMNVATGTWKPTWDGCWWRKQVDWSQTCLEACLMDWREWRGRIWESWQIFPSWIGYSKTHPCSLRIYNHWESEETQIYCSLL